MKYYLLATASFILAVFFTWKGASSKPEDLKITSKPEAPAPQPEDKEVRVLKKTSIDGNANTRVFYSIEIFDSNQKIWRWHSVHLTIEEAQEKAEWQRQWYRSLKTDTVKEEVVAESAKPEPSP